MNTTATPQHFTSIGKAASLLGVTPMEVRRMLDRTGLEPSLVLDNIPMLTPADIDQLEADLRQRAANTSTES